MLTTRTTPRRARLTLLLLLMLPLSARSETDWPQFRGPTAVGLAPEAAVPTRWSPAENVAWRKAIPGHGWSSPVVQGGRIFLTTAVPGRGGRELRALSLDAKSGETLWNVALFEQMDGRTDPVHPKNSHASPTPLAADGLVYVHFGTTGTACLDRDGKVVWKNSDIRYEPRHGGGSSPVLAGQALVLACDGSREPFVIALDRSTGKRLWRQPRPTFSGNKFSFSTPLVIEVGGRSQVVSAGSGAVCAYAPDTGEEIWRVHYEGGYSVVPRPVYGDGVLFVCTGFNRASLVAIRPDGRGDVTGTHVAWKESSNVPLTPSVIVREGALYYVSDNGIATCTDARTGRRHWRHRLGGAYSASPVCVGDTIYFQSEEGETVVVRATTEKFVELARNSLGERTLASCAVSGAALFLRGEEHLYRIEESARP